MLINLFKDRHYQYVWLCAFAGSVFLMMTAFFLGTIGIDDEIHATKSELSGIGRGLWGFELITYILPGQLGISFAPLFLGILLYATSTTLLIYLWQLKDPVLARLSALVIGSFPYFAAMMTFDSAQVAYPLGFVCVILSLYPVFIINKNPIANYTIGILLFAFAFSLYQGVGATYMAAYTSTIIIRFFSSTQKNEFIRSTLKKYIPRFIFFSAAGSLVYLFITKLIIAVVPHTPWPDTYAVSFDLRIWERLHPIAFNILRLLTGGVNDLPEASVFIFFVLLVILSLSVFVMNQINCWKKLIVIIFLWVAICISPFWLLFVQKHGLVPRSSVGLGIQYSLLFVALALNLKKSFRPFFISIACFWCFQFILLGNQMYYTQHLAYLADRDTANRIANRIDNLKGIDQLNYPIPVTFVGRYFQPNNGLARYNVLGASFFDWGNGSIGRQIAFFRLINIPGFEFKADVNRESIQNFIIEKQIPSWPQVGSVFIYDNEIVVVNLGNGKSTHRRWKESVEEKYKTIANFINTVY